MDNIFWLELQFDTDYEEFKQSVEALKEQLQLFVDSWFEKSLSVSFAAVLYERWESLFVELTSVI